MSESPFDCAERASEFVDAQPIAKKVVGVERAMTAIEIAEACVTGGALGCGQALVDGLAAILEGVPELGIGPAGGLAYDTIKEVLQDSAGVFNCVGRVLQNGASTFHGCSSI